MCESCRTYIHENAVKRRLAASVGDYPYNSVHLAVDEAPQRLKASRFAGLNRTAESVAPPKSMGLGFVGIARFENRDTWAHGLESGYPNCPAFIDLPGFTHVRSWHA